MRKSSAGVNQLNTALQALLNPPAPDKAELQLGRLLAAAEAGDNAAVVIRQGDRVIQCSNNYQMDVFNGDIGFVAQVNRAARELVVQFPGTAMCFLP